MLSGADSGTSWRWRFEDAEFDEARMALQVGGQPVPVEPKPLQLLAELVRHVNEAVTRDELFDAVWAGQVTVDHVLASAVNRLRKALGPAAAARIVTLPRIGYRLDGPVERLAVATSMPPPSPLEVGQAVPLRPGFRLRQKLGSGSGGEVWLARHAALGEQRVFKFASSPEQLRALKREFTLQRLLRAELGELPGLAPLLDAQFAELPFHLESPWLGPDLGQWASTQTALQEMNPDERLALLLPVVAALADAHAIGVLHKDIKPGNILIGGEAGNWQARIADFGSGLAQQPERLRELGLTALGLTVTDQEAAGRAGGTVLYLAPELLAGQAATVQSDLYALGLVLYQTLVADFNRPLAGAWQEDVSCELLREDIAMATAALPTRRLSSVREWLERLQTLPQRRLALQQARAAAEEQRRSQAQLAAARARRPWILAAMVMLALGLALALGALWQAERQRQRAEAESARAAAIGQFLHRDLMQSASIIGIGRRFQPQTLLDVLRKASVSAGERFQGQPRTEGELRRRLAETYIELAAFPEADADSARAVELLAPHARPDDEALLLARFERVRVHTWRERHAEALRELEAAERDAGTLLTGQDSLLAHAAVRARLLLTSHIVAGHLSPHLSNETLRQSWLPLARRFLELSDALAGRHGTDGAAARQMLAEALWWQGQHNEARRLLVELTQPPFSRRSAVLEFDARLALKDAQAARAAQRLDEALAHYQRGISLLVERSDDTNEFTLGWLEFEAAQTMLMLGRGDLALQTLRTAQQRFRQLLGPEHHYIMSTERDMGVAQLLAGRPREALIHLNRAETDERRVLGRVRWAHWTALLRAMAHNDLGQGADALRWLDGVDVATVSAQVAMPELKRLVQAERGQALVQTGRSPEGQALLAEARGDVSESGLWPSLRRRLHAAAGPR